MMALNKTGPKPSIYSDHFLPEKAVFTALRHPVPYKMGQKTFGEIYPALTYISDFNVYAATKHAFRRAKGNIFSSCHSPEHVHTL